EVMVSLLLMLVVFVVLLRFWGTIIFIMRGLGEDYFFCLFKKIISAYTKVPLAGIQVWGAFCPPIITTVAMQGFGDRIVALKSPIADRHIDQLAKGYLGATILTSDGKTQLSNQKDTIEQSLKTTIKGEQAGFTEKTASGPSPNNFVLRYRLDEAVARAMKKCWGRNGEGALPLGEQWRDGYFNNPFTPIFYCDLCEVIKFQPDVKSYFAGQKLVMNEFLQRNPVDRTTYKSYWEYLKDDSSPSDFFRTWHYSVDEDLAIIYVRANPHKVREIIEGITQPVLEFFDANPMVPYDDIAVVPLSSYQKACVGEAGAA
ncbi:hypothetical protein HYU13_04445, partial [Candidatus Woesearchaeota archaeon]|nr:hypothetical protein [Candidatus Woesearchaeota archaeon]